MVSVFSSKIFIFFEHKWVIFVSKHVYLIYILKKILNEKYSSDYYMHSPCYKKKKGLDETLHVAYAFDIKEQGNYRNNGTDM